MVLLPVALPAVLFAQAAPPPLPPLAATPEFEAVADDVAEVATNVCWRLATGELGWAPRDVNEEMARVEALNLTYGIPSGVLDTLGPAGEASVNRATMASRSRNGFHTILALGGTIPGCRVMLAGDNRPGMADSVATSLQAQGWFAVDAITSKSDTLERRLFVRHAGGRSYRLDFSWGGNPSSQLRILISVSPVS